MIEVDGTMFNMFEIMGNWLQETDPSVAITQPGGVEFCPGAQAVPTLSEAAIAVLAISFLVAGAVCVRQCNPNAR